MPVHGERQPVRRPNLVRHVDADPLRIEFLDKACEGGRRRASCAPACGTAPMHRATAMSARSRNISRDSTPELITTDDTDDTDNFADWYVLRRVARAEPA